KFTNAQIVVGNYVMPLGEVAPNQTKTIQASTGHGVPLKDFVSTHGRNFHSAISSRQQAFGQTERIMDLPNASAPATFISQFGGSEENYMGSFITPPGLDLSHVIERGGAVVLAWADDYSPVKPMYQFSPRRSHKDTLWRVAVEVKPKA